MDKVKNIQDGRCNVVTMFYFNIFWYRSKIQHLPRLKKIKRLREWGRWGGEAWVKRIHSHTELSATIHTHMLHTPQEPLHKSRQCEGQREEMWTFLRDCIRTCEKKKWPFTFHTSSFFFLFFPFLLLSSSLDSFLLYVSFLRLLKSLFDLVLVFTVAKT